MLLDDLAKDVPRNLFDMLVQFRLREGTRKIWVDAVCIIEKSSRMPRTDRVDE
jgi:Heterokaryon incompatibility protein (HET)